MHAQTQHNLEKLLCKGNVQDQTIKASNEPDFQVTIFKGKLFK